MGKKGNSIYKEKNFSHSVSRKRSDSEKKGGLSFDRKGKPLDSGKTRSYGKQRRVGAQRGEEIEKKKIFSTDRGRGAAREEHGNIDERET